MNDLNEKLFLAFLLYAVSFSTFLLAVFFFFSSIFGATFRLKTHSEEFCSHHWITVYEFTFSKLGIINLLAQLCSLKENQLCFAYLCHVLVLNFIFLFCNFCLHLFAFLFFGCCFFFFNLFFFYSFAILSSVLNNMYLISCKILGFLSLAPKASPFSFSYASALGNISSIIFTVKPVMDLLLLPTLRGMKAA